MNPLWLAALLLACRAGAANVQGTGAVVYPAPPTAWTQTLSLPAVLSQAPGLSALNERSLGPIAHELTQSLHYTPEAFAKMPEGERATAVHLAYEQVKFDLMQQVYELAAQTKKLSASKDVDRAQLDALYPLAAKLQEIERHYGPFLGETEKQVVAENSAQASAAWRKARAAFIAAFGEATKKGLETGKLTSGVEPAVLMPKAAKPLNPGTSARKLLESMKSTKSGWGESDMETVYLGYGFTFRDGAKHRMYYHPDFPQLHTTVSRQRSLPPGYSHTAVKLIAELEALSAPAGLDLAAAANDNDGDLPPPLDESYFKKSERKTPPKGLAAVKTDLSPEKPVAQPEILVAKAAVPARAVVADPAKLQPADLSARAEPEPSPLRVELENATFTPAAPEQGHPKVPWWRAAWKRLLGKK